jgi:Kef-type K+ transport system membrane component KefB
METKAAEDSPGSDAGAVFLGFAFAIIAFVIVVVFLPRAIYRRFVRWFLSQNSNHRLSG